MAISIETLEKQQERIIELEKAVSRLKRIVENEQVLRLDKMCGRIRGLEKEAFAKELEKKGYKAESPEEDRQREILKKLQALEEGRFPYLPPRCYFRACCPYLAPLPPNPQEPIIITYGSSSTGEKPD